MARATSSESGKLTTLQIITTRTRTGKAMERPIIRTRQVVDSRIERPRNRISTRNTQGDSQTAGAKPSIIPNRPATWHGGISQTTAARIMSQPLKPGVMTPPSARARRTAATTRAAVATKVRTISGKTHIGKECMTPLLRDSIKMIGRLHGT